MKAGQKKFYLFMANVFCLLTVYVLFLLYAISGYVFKVETPHNTITLEANMTLVNTWANTFGASSINLLVLILLLVGTVFVFCIFISYELARRPLVLTRG